MSCVNYIAPKPLNLFYHCRNHNSMDADLLMGFSRASSTFSVKRTVGCSLDSASSQNSPRVPVMQRFLLPARMLQNWVSNIMTAATSMVYVSLVPRPSIVGGRPGIHCLRMRLISPKILENRISRYSSVKR